MSIELYLIRHGLAGEHGSYANDGDRPLTEEGHRKTQQVAERLRSLELHVDLILTSPLVRARQTAEILYTAGFSQQLEESPHLAPTGKFNDWLLWFDQWRQSSGARLALVGHEPDLSTWAEQLIWGSAKHHLILKKAGVVGLLLPPSGSPVGASELFWFTPPRFLVK